MKKIIYLHNVKLECPLVQMHRQLVQLGLSVRQLINATQYRLWFSCYLIKNKEYTYLYN